MTMRLIPASNLEFYPLGGNVIVKPARFMPRFVIERLADAYVLLDGVKAATVEDGDGDPFIRVTPGGDRTTVDAVFDRVFRLNMAIKSATAELGYDVLIKGGGANSSGFASWRAPLVYSVWDVKTARSLRLTDDMSDSEAVQLFSDVTGIEQVVLEDGGRQLIIPMSSWRGNGQELAMLVAMYLWSADFKCIVRDRLPAEMLAKQALIESH